MDAERASEGFGRTSAGKPMGEAMECSGAIGHRPLRCCCPKREKENQFFPEKCLY